VVKTFQLQDNQLVETSSQEATSGAGEAEASADIVGIVWNWEQFQDMAEQNNIVVPSPSAYQLELLPDGTFRAKPTAILSVAAIPWTALASPWG